MEHQTTYVSHLRITLLKREYQQASCSGQERAPVPTLPGHHPVSDSQLAEQEEVLTDLGLALRLAATQVPVQPCVICVTCMCDMFTCMLGNAELQTLLPCSLLVDQEGVGWQAAGSGPGSTTCTCAVGTGSGVLA